MYINPETNIRILHNVPLDNTYQHTFRFSSASEQAAYFMSKQKYSLMEYTYQRVQRGRARVGYKADDLYDCNYMMFQNTAFGNKWFYAFITGVEYINNVTSDITFEIDVMQTWYFDWTFEDCFIERQHTATDEIGDNIVAEPVQTGEYIFANGYKTVDLSDLIVIVAICDSETKDTANLYDGVFNGCQLYAFNTDDVAGIRNLLNGYLAAPDSVVAMYMVPRACTRTTINTDGKGTPLKPTDEAPKHEFGYDAPAPGDTIGERGYVPKNNKMYTYPYNYLRVFTGSGSSINTRFEFFIDHIPRFQYYCPITNPVQIVCFPLSYKSSGHNNVYPDENISVSGFPMCSWNNDTYKIWTAQNNTPNIMSIGNAAVNGVIAGGAAGSIGGPAGTVGGAAVGGILGALGQVQGIMKEDYKASIAADQYRGSANTGTTLTAAKLNNIYYGRVCVTDDYARMIDNFFTMYGYAIKKVERPNIYSRPNWNYIKTVGCSVNGSVPADDMKTICQIHDNGITYWNSEVTPCDYSLDNAPA